MKSYPDRGVVVRTWPLGEADRIVALFTREHGKLRAVGKGARGPKSRISGLLQPTSELDLLLFRGRELDVIQQASLRQTNLAQPGVDPAQFGVALEFLEVLDSLTLDRHPDPIVYELLVRGLRLFTEAPTPALLGSLVLRLLEIEGYAPNLEGCGLCGGDGPFASFDFASSAPRCLGCGGESVGPDVIAMTSLVLAHRVSEVLRDPSDASGRELDAFALRLVREVVGRGLRSTVVSATLVQAHPSSTTTTR